MSLPDPLSFLHLGVSSKEERERVRKKDDGERRSTEEEKREKERYGAPDIGYTVPSLS